jgi:hypothetical protein
MDVAGAGCKTRLLLDGAGELIGLLAQTVPDHQALFNAGLLARSVPQGVPLSAHQVLLNVLGCAVA